MVMETVRRLWSGVTDYDYLRFANTNNLLKSSRDRQKLIEPGNNPTWYRVSYDQSIGLVPLMRRAVGQDNISEIRQEITQKRFPLMGLGIRSVKAKVQPYLDGETRAQGAKRFVDSGYLLGNVGDLAVFMHNYPQAMVGWGWVDALNEDGRTWIDSEGRICVANASVLRTRRAFAVGGLQSRVLSFCGALIINDEQKH